MIFVKSKEKIQRYLLFINYWISIFLYYHIVHDLKFWQTIEKITPSFYNFITLFLRFGVWYATQNRNRRYFELCGKTKKVICLVMFWYICNINFKMTWYQVSLFKIEYQTDICTMIRGVHCFKLKMFAEHYILIHLCIIVHHNVKIINHFTSIPQGVNKIDPLSYYSCLNKYSPLHMISLFLSIRYLKMILVS